MLHEVTWTLKNDKKKIENAWIWLIWGNDWKWRWKWQTYISTRSTFLYLKFSVVGFIEIKLFPNNVQELNRWSCHSTQRVKLSRFDKTYISLRRNYCSRKSVKNESRTTTFLKWYHSKCFYWYCFLNYFFLAAIMHKYQVQTLQLQSTMHLKMLAIHSNCIQKCLQSRRYQKCPEVCQVLVRQWGVWPGQSELLPRSFNWGLEALKLGGKYIHIL